MIFKPSVDSLFQINFFGLSSIDHLVIFLNIAFGSGIEHHNSSFQNHIEERTLIPRLYHNLALSETLCSQTSVELPHILVTVTIAKLVEKLNLVEPIRQNFANLFITHLIRQHKHLGYELLVIGVVFVHI